MQSSPPIRAWQPPQQPSSPAETQYSLDLGALCLDSVNDSPPIPKPRVDRVLSEDIDGPSDFTLNMEKWMHGSTTAGTRGGTMRSTRGTMRSMMGALQSLREQQEAEKGASRSDALEVPQSPLLEDDAEPTQSHHTPDHSPPKESPWHERPSVFSEGEQHDRSDWDPYGQSGTPQPPEHKDFLQPTVEDYYSELTPARPQSARAPSLHLATDSKAAARPQSPEQSESETPGRPSSATLSPVRSPMMQRSQPHSVSSPPTEPDFSRQLQTQLQQLRIRCQQLESMNSALKQALDDEQRIRHAEKRSHEHKLAAEVSEYQKQLQTSEQGAQSLREAVTAAEDERDQLRTELDAIKLNELPKLQDQLQSSEQAVQSLREAVTAAEDDRDQLRTELDTIKLDHEDATSVLNDGHRKALQDLRKEVNELQNELHEEQVGHDAEIERLTAAHSDAVAEAKRVRGQEVERLTADHGKALAANNEEIERLKAEHATALEDAKKEKDAVTDQHEAQQSRLNDAILERDQAQDSLTGLQSEVDTLRTELEKMREESKDRDAISTAFEAKISEGIRKREAYWKDRLAASEKEKKGMAKALMRQWGREEVGVMEPEQAYEYQFVTKSQAAQV